MSQVKKRGSPSLSSSLLPIRETALRSSANSMKTGTKPKKHVCGTCRKPFTTKEARRQHSNTLHRVLRPLQEQQGQRQPQEDVGRSRGQPPGGLSHRNIMYSTLSPGQQLTLRGELPGLCLTEARLSLEGYMIREGASIYKGKNQVPGLPFLPSSSPVTAEVHGHRS